MEIGVPDNPFLTKGEYSNVKYADIRSKEEILDEYISDKEQYKEIYIYGAGMRVGGSVLEKKPRRVCGADG